MLQQSGLAGEWWPRAACHWVACYSAALSDESDTDESDTDERSERLQDGCEVMGSVAEPVVVEGRGNGKDCERYLTVGWRIDISRVRRVSAPPWSRQPPHIEPEVWVMMPRSAQEEFRNKWVSDDPEG